MTGVVALNNADNATLDRLVLSKDRQQKLRYKFSLLDQLPGEFPARDWLLKNIIAAGETSAWIGPPGSLKSALMGELIFSIATKQDWHGHKAKRSGLTVYFALERADLVKRRLVAYRNRFSGDPADIGPIAIIPGIFNLADPASLKEIIASIRAAEEETGEKCVFTVWDTFAKIVAAGGGDENQAKDLGKVFIGLQRIKDAIGCHVALVGHTGKDEGRGARGSNAFDGDVDVVVQISGEATKTASVTKANEIAEGPLFSFKSELHEFGTDEDGDPITVNVVSPDEIAPPATKTAEPRLSINQRVMYRLLVDAGPSGLSTEVWSNLAQEQGIKSKQARYDLRMALKDKGLVREYNGIWNANK